MGRCFSYELLAKLPPTSCTCNYELVESLLGALSEALLFRPESWVGHKKEAQTVIYYFRTESWFYSHNFSFHYFNGLALESQRNMRLISGDPCRFYLKCIQEQECIGNVWVTSLQWALNEMFAISNVTWETGEKKEQLGSSWLTGQQP